MKTIAHLVSAGFRVAPWSTSTAVVGGFLLLPPAFRLQERATFAVLEKYQVPDHHFGAYVFFATDGLIIGRFFLSMIVGCVIALVAKGREMVATTMLGLLLCTMTGAAVPVLVARKQGFLLLWTLPWQFACWGAIVIGGAIVRTHRSASITYPSDA